MENIYKHLLENGIEIRCNSHVEKILREGERFVLPVRGKGEIECTYLIAAPGAPVRNGLPSSARIWG